MSDKKFTTYGDSVTGDTRIMLGDGSEPPISSLFDGAEVTLKDGKEYCQTNHQAVTYNLTTGKNEIRGIKYVMRHLTDKPIYRVWLNNSTWLDVAEDHSLMGVIGGRVIEITPQQVVSTRCPLICHEKITDTLIPSSIREVPGFGSDIVFFSYLKIETLPRTQQYVYDIEVDETHTFYANDILVHNTDSAYVSLDAFAKHHDVELDHKSAVAVADRLAERLREELPGKLAGLFLTTPEATGLLVAGREVVAETAIFKDVKKRYALYVYDDEGKSVQKTKIMGMEVKRSDTPIFVQDFLQTILEAVLKESADFAHIKGMVDEFRDKFRKLDPWRTGVPGRVKNLKSAAKQMEDYNARLARGHFNETKPRIHHTVAAALNTNYLMAKHGETRWGAIRDGDKIQVIALKSDSAETVADGIKTVAINVDEIGYVPQWFQDLPFDMDVQEHKLIDKKVFNVIGDVMNWDFTPPISYSEEVVEEDDGFYN